MLELTYLLLFVTALWCAKSAIIERRAEIETSLIATIIFAILTFASFDVQPAFSPEDSVAMEPVATIAGFGSVLCFVVLVMAVTNNLPQTNSNADQIEGLDNVR